MVHEGEVSKSSTRRRPSRRYSRAAEHDASLFMELLLWSVLGAAIGHMAARRRGFSLAKGVTVGFLLGGLAMLLFFVPGTVVPDAQLRECPYCDDRIEADVRICTSCGALLVGASESRGPGSEEEYRQI